MRLRITVAAALGALCGVASERGAAAWTPLDPIAPRWGDLPAGYYVNRSSVPTSIANIAAARIDAGFGVWGKPACTVWQAQNLGDTIESYRYDDGKNVLVWVSARWPSVLGDVSSIMGVTLPVWGDDNVIDDADTVFNNVGFCWNDSGMDGCVDTQSITTHEAGHFLGLGHTNVLGATMSVVYPQDQSMRTLEKDDIDGVCALYPAGGTAVSSGGGVLDCTRCWIDSVSGGACTLSFNACAAGGACRDLFDCIAGCGDDACVEVCEGTHAAGMEPYTEMMRCKCADCGAACADECAGGQAGAGAGGGGGAEQPGGSAGFGAGGEDRSRGIGGHANDDSGCGCSAVGSPTGMGGVLLAALVSASARRRRKDR